MSRDNQQDTGRPGIRRDFRAAAIGGLAATFVVAAAFAPRFIGGSGEVRVRNSSTESAAPEPTTPTAGAGDGEITTTTVPGPTTSSTGATPSSGRPHVAAPASPTTTTPANTGTTSPSQPTTTTPAVPPSAPTGVALRPANWYATWTYSDAVSLSWYQPTWSGPYRVRYGTTTVDATTCCTLMLTGLQPDSDYTFTVTAFNQAGESPPVSMAAHTRPDNAPVLSSIVKTGPGSFHITAPNLQSAYVYLVVPGIDTVEHPPQPVCSAGGHDGQADCTFKNLDPGHWEVHSLRIVDTAGRSTSYFADGRLVEYNLAAGQAISVAGPYQKTTLDFRGLSFDV